MWIMRLTSVYSKHKPVQSKHLDLAEILSIWIMKSGTVRRLTRDEFAKDLGGSA
jgi:hypothetical protein